MAKVCKCDRCGKYYDNAPDDTVYNLTKTTDSNIAWAYRSIDLCPECQEKFEAIVREFLEQRPLENIDVIKLYFGPGRVG